MTTHIDFYPKNADGTPHYDKPMLGEQPAIHPTCLVYDSYLGVFTEVGMGCRIVESSMGDYSYLADNVDMIYTRMGKFCSIASHVRINPGNHPMERVTQHHMTYRRQQYGFGEDDASFFDWRRADACNIGHDVWIGHGVTVMPGVSIGTGAVIGSGAVVTKDIEAYMIAVGVPARPLRPRFEAHIAQKLLQIAWWDWDRAVLQERFKDLYDVERFVQMYAG
jgi:phosphonate metabolism protein (transferase hexapeptide repeat family)